MGHCSSRVVVEKVLTRLKWALAWLQEDPAAADVVKEILGELCLVTSVIYLLAKVVKSPLGGHRANTEPRSLNPTRFTSPQLLPLPRLVCRGLLGLTVFLNNTTWLLVSNFKEFLFYCTQCMHIIYSTFLQLVKTAFNICLDSLTLHWWVIRNASMK
jgi:hypothetical protein